MQLRCPRTTTAPPVKYNPKVRNTRISKTNNKKISSPQHALHHISNSKGERKEKQTATDNNPTLTHSLTQLSAGTGGGGLPLYCSSNLLCSSDPAAAPIILGVFCTTTYPSVPGGLGAVLFGSAPLVSVTLSFSS